jgi:hypothetical protein
VGTIFGIDPGNNGGVIAMYERRDGWYLVRSFKLARGETDIVQFFREETDAGSGDCLAYLEKVHGWGEGRSFNFGMYYGFVRGVLRAMEVPIIDVTPQKWMKDMGVPPQKGQKAAHRLAMRELAQSLQNEVTATNWNAAAILIALYGLRQETGRGLLDDPVRAIMPA